MVGFYTKFTTNAEDREKLVALLSKASTSMKEVAGCKVYEVALDAIDPTVTVATEIWADEATHDASLQGNTAKALIVQAMPLMAAPPKQIKLGPVVTSWFD